RQYGGRSTWTLMATSLSVAQTTLATHSGAFGPVARRTRPSRQRLIKARRSIWAAAWSVVAGLTREGFPGNVSWQSTVRVVPRTTTFICWQAWNPLAAAERT